MLPCAEERVEVVNMKTFHERTAEAPSVPLPQSRDICLFLGGFSGRPHPVSEVRVFRIQDVFSTLTTAQLESTDANNCNFKRIDSFKDWRNG